MKTNKPHIAIDGTPAINDIRAIQRYTSYLISELASLNTELDCSVLYLSVKNKSRKLPDINSALFSEIKSRIPGHALNILWKIFHAPKASWWIKKSFDLIHFPGGLPYIPTKCKKILTTLHGFHYHQIPSFMNIKNSDKIKKQLDFTMTKSSDFITVSEANKSEAIKLWNVQPEKITPIPLGISPEFKKYDLNDETKQSIQKRYNLPAKPFILFVGALEPHKNIKNIIFAYHKLPSSIKDKYQLILVGQETPYCQGYREQIISLGLSNKISFIDYIQPGSVNLAYLYNMAELFVFPTFYEGWASPPLEAMKCGTPAIVSDIPSLRESTGGISIYPNPDNPQEIAEKIQKLLEDKDLYLTQQAKGLEFTKQYTWKRCAESTLNLYSQLIN